MAVPVSPVQRALSRLGSALWRPGRRNRRLSLQRRRLRLWGLSVLPGLSWRFPGRLPQLDHATRGKLRPALARRPLSVVRLPRPLAVLAALRRADAAAWTVSFGWTARSYTGPP